MKSKVLSLTYTMTDTHMSVCVCVLIDIKGTVREFTTHTHTTACVGKHTHILMHILKSACVAIKMLDLNYCFEWSQKRVAYDRNGM